jgi:hypothetical protein
MEPDAIPDLSRQKLQAGRLPQSYLHSIPYIPQMDENTLREQNRQDLRDGTLVASATRLVGRSAGG